MRVLVSLTVTCLIWSCAPPDYGELRPGVFLLTGGAQYGYAIKQVVEKEQPAVLIAEDGSICRTSVMRFRATDLGRWIDCNWTPGLDLTPLAVAPS